MTVVVRSSPLPTALPPEETLRCHTDLTVTIMTKIRA
jgi:hypothetical protein